MKNSSLGVSQESSCSQSSCLGISPWAAQGRAQADRPRGSGPRPGDPGRPAPAPPPSTTVIPAKAAPRPSTQCAATPRSSPSGSPFHGFVVQTQTASLAINGSPGASRLVCHGPCRWCALPTSSRTGNCRGMRVDGGCGARGAGAHATTFSWCAHWLGACPGAPGGHRPSRSPDATPSRPPGMPGTDRRDSTAFRTEPPPTG